jgi:hypothetical protein
MARDFQRDGEVLIRVKFGAHVPPQATLAGGPSNLSDLGLADKNTVKIRPLFYHKEIPVDDFGQHVPPEALAIAAAVDISMVLVHYDPDIVDICQAESLGGMSQLLQPSVSGHQSVAGVGYGANSDIAGLAGTLAPAGTPLGGGVPLLASGNHYVSLNLFSPVLQFPLHIPSTYLTGQPVEIPMGVAYNPLVLRFRAIPYKFPLALSGNQFVASGQLTGSLEVSSSGAVLWDHVTDS